MVGTLFYSCNYFKLREGGYTDSRTTARLRVLSVNNCYNGRRYMKLKAERSPRLALNSTLTANCDEGFTTP